MLELTSPVTKEYQLSRLNEKREHDTSQSQANIIMTAIQQGQLSQRDHTILCVIQYFAKSLKVITYI